MLGLEGKLKDYWANITETICTHISIKELDKIWHNFRLVSVAQWNLQYSCLTWHWNLLSYVPWLSSVNDITNHRCFFVQQITSVMSNFELVETPWDFWALSFDFWKWILPLVSFLVNLKPEWKLLLMRKKPFPGNSVTSQI